MWLVGLAVPDGSALVQQQWYFALWAVLVTIMVMALVAVTAASVPSTPWRAAQVALSPVLVVAALVSVDLLGVLLASVALLAWGRSKILLAGFLFGLAISARSYPLVLVVAIGLLALRSGRVAEWRKLALTALATWFVVSLPWIVMNADGLISAYRTWWRSGAGYGSLWIVPSLLGHGLPQVTATVLAILGWVLALMAGAVLALSLDRRPTVAEISLVMLVIVVVTGKAVPIQAGLWLLPLVALIGLKWRDHLIWAGFEVTYFVAVWLYIAGLSKPERGLPKGVYSVFLGLRLAAMVFLLVQVWRGARSRLPVREAVAGAESDETTSGAPASGSAETPERVAGDAEPRERSPDEAGSAAGKNPTDVTSAVDEDDEDEVDSLAGPMAGAPDQVLIRFG
jgi:uncharacterized membrane protein